MVWVGEGCGGSVRSPYTQKVIAGCYGSGISFEFPTTRLVTSATTRLTLKSNRYLFPAPIINSGCRIAKHVFKPPGDDELHWIGISRDRLEVGLPALSLRGL